MNNQILICNFERQNEINKRILERNIFFDNNNNNVLELRSQCTKYTFPILNNNNNDNCFNIEKIVTNNNLCYNKFCNNIDIESELKNQNTILDKSENKYIPCSKSDLYEYNITNDNNNAEMLYPHLSNNQIVREPDKKYNYKNSLFNNDTRQDLKN
jgi:predicted transcriptional regulator